MHEEIEAALMRAGHQITQLQRENERLQASERSAWNAAIAATERAEAAEKHAKLYLYLRNRNRKEVISGHGPSAGAWIDCESEERMLTLLTGEDADAFITAAITAKGES